MSLVGELVRAVSNRQTTAYPMVRDNGMRTLTAKGTTNAENQMQSYGEISTLFAVVSKIASSTGSVKWRLYKKKTDKRRVYGDPQAEEDDRTEVTSHVALECWNNPNPFYTQQLFVESGQQHIDLTGEACLMIGRSSLSPMPLELWVVRPDLIECVPHPTKFLAGYWLKGSNGQRTWLNTDELIHIKMPNPLDPYRGLGPVQALMTDLYATKAAATYNQMFFQNDATPGGVIEFENRLSDPEFDEFSARWRQGHQGVNNAHRWAVVDNGGVVKPLQYTLRDMQFTELRHVSREIIREAFAMHGHMLGLTEDINRANAEAAETVFARWVLNNRLERWRDALNFQFLPLFGSTGRNVEFDFDDPSLEDSEAENAKLTAQSNAAKVLIDAGGDFDSTLEAVGLPKIEKDALKEEAAQAALDGQKQSQELEREGFDREGEEQKKSPAKKAGASEKS